MSTPDTDWSPLRQVTKVDAVVVARVIQLDRTLAFCTCAISAAGSDKPAAFATGTYAILG